MELTGKRLGLAILPDLARVMGGETRAIQCATRALVPEANALDCRRCGACCCNPDENRAEGYVDYVAVAPSEPILRRPELVRRFVVYNAAGEAHMRLLDQRCAALRGTLGRRVECQVYDLRPAGCRKVEAGGERCRQYRRERGIDPHT